MKKILFIEDESRLNEAYRNKFEKDYQVDFVADGREGLKKTEEWQPDLIVLDIMIPGEMNGIGVLKELKLNTKTASIPVLVLTNLSDQEETVKSLGAVECLIKTDTSFDAVAEKINKLLV